MNDLDASQTQQQAAEPSTATNNELRLNDETISLMGSSSAGAGQLRFPLFRLPVATCHYMKAKHLCWGNIKLFNLRLAVATTIFVGDVFFKKNISGYCTAPDFTWVLFSHMSATGG